MKLHEILKLKNIEITIITKTGILNSAVHRSRRAGAGAGVLPYFAGAGAGAGVCSPPAKLRQHLFVLQTSIIDQRKTNSIEEKVNTAQYSLTQTYKL